MKDKEPDSTNEILRQKAEEILRNKPIIVDTLFLQGETLKLIHELDVHQIELEMQNEELRLAKGQIEIAAEKYIDLYDFAPSGYFTLSTIGEIHKLNFKAADMLGKERSLLLNNRFGFFVTHESKSIFSSFLDRIFESQTKQTCEITLAVNPGKPTYLLLNGITVNEDDHCFITAVDISQLKKTEIALKKSELLLHSSIDSQKDSLIFSIDTDYNYLTYNKAHCEAMKSIYNSDIKIGVNILECISSIEDRTSAKENYDRALAGESHSNINPLGTQELAYYERFFYPIISSNKIVGVSCLFRNITARLQIEEEVKVNEEKYRTLFDSNRDSISIFRLTPDGKAENFIEANAATTEIYGFTREELMQMNLKDLEPIAIKIRKQRIATLLAKGRLDFETIITTKKGKSRNIEVELLIINYLNEPAVMNITRDITDRKQIELNAKKAQENLLTILEAIPDLLFEVNQQGLIHHYQSHQIDLLTASPEAFIGKLLKDILPAEAANIFMDAIEEASQKGFSSGKQYSLDLAKGKYWFELSVSTIKESDPEERHFIILARDITERKIIEIALRENEQKYRGLVENSTDAVAIYVEGKIAFINDEYIRMLGAKSKEEIIGKAVLQFVHPDSVASIVQRMEKVILDNSASPTVEEKFMDLAGNPIDVEIKGIPTIFEHKAAVQVIIHDITKRKQSLLELNKMNRVYSLISQINNLILRSKNREELLHEICRIAVTYGKFRMSWIGMLDEDGKTVNKAAFNGVEDGYLSVINQISILEEPIGQGPVGTAMREGRTVICNNIATESIMENWRERAEARGYRSVISIPIVVLDKIIGSFNLYSEDTNSFSSHEEVELLEKITQNIAFTLESILFEEDRIKTQEKIKQLSQAVEQSPVTIIITNTEGNIEYVNQKFVETSGYSIDEVLGQNPRFLKSGHTSPKDYKLMWQTLLAGNEWHGEFHNVKKDGGLFWESASISPILNVKGKTTHYIAIKEDITARKKVEKELIKAKEKAEESDRLKLAFLANMSHEIRTPMNGILGFTELLKSPNLAGEEQQEYIRIIEKSGVRMLNIINDIINISKVESGHIEISLSETNLNEQIEYLYTFFKPEALQKGLSLSVTKKLAAKESIITTDREKLYAILTNLVKNAIKFTDTGFIEFGCVKKDSFFEFYVKDSGVGISESQKKIIFERFRRGNETITRTHEGSGLGLAISKAYVEILRGKIWVESEQGKGSTFYFSIPANAELKSLEKATPKVKSASEEKEENQIKDLKVLIVEDDEISKLLITIAIKKFSKEILKVSTGFEAIEACRNNPDIDLVMMDINMPEMGGYEATEQIRKFNKDVVIIAQTANGMQSDRDEAIAAGCTDYISKPVNITSLSTLIHKYFKS